MPKYPGGYQIIDLKGINLEIGGDPVQIDPEPWLYVVQYKKPALISNFTIGGARVSPTLIDCEVDMNDMAIAIIQGGGTSLTVQLGNLESDEVTIEAVSNS